MYSTTLLLNLMLLMKMMEKLFKLFSLFNSIFINFCSVLMPLGTTINVTIKAELFYQKTTG